MKLIKKTTLLSILVLIIISLIITSCSNSTDQPNKQTLSVSVPAGCKSSVLSIDEVSLTRDASELGEKVFQLTLSGREGGQCIVGYLDSNELKQEISSKIGKQVEVKYSNPFIMTIQRLETNAYYKIATDDYTSINNYQYYPSSSPKATFSNTVFCTTGTPLGQASCRSQCSNIGYIYYNCEGTINTKCYCWNFKEYGISYEFNKDRLQEILNIVVTTGDGYTKNIIKLDTDSNRDQYSTEIRDGLYTTLEGFLQGEKLIPDSKDYKIFNKDAKKMVSYNMLNKVTQSPLCQNQISYSKIESCMLSYNNNLYSGIKTPSEFLSATIPTYNTVKLPISKDTFYPLIKVQVKAKWLGIYEPVAKPNIFNCQGLTLEFRNKREGYATYDLKLVPGSGEQGTFNIYSSCPNNFEIIPTEETKTVVGTEVVSGKIRVTQNDNLASSTKCTLTASIQRLGYSEKDTCEITVIGKSSCTIATESCTSVPCCEGLTCKNGVCEARADVEICYDKQDNDGDGLVDCLDKDCKGSMYCGEECTKLGSACLRDSECCTGLICKESKCQETEECANIPWYRIDKKISCWATSFFSIFKLITSIIGGLIILLYSYNILKRKAFTEKKQDYLNWIFGLVFGIAAGILIYTYVLATLTALLIVGIIIIILLILFPTFTANMVGTIRNVSRGR